jgi:hypothetical protein
MSFEHCGKVQRWDGLARLVLDRVVSQAPWTLVVAASTRLYPTNLPRSRL